MENGDTGKVRGLRFKGSLIRKIHETRKKRPLSGENGREYHRYSEKLSNCTFVQFSSAYLRLGGDCEVLRIRNIITFQF